MDRRTALLLSLATGVPSAWAHLLSEPQVEDSQGPSSGSTCGSRPGHLAPAPIGVDSGFAARFRGGRGEGQHFVEVEQGWTLTHDSLLAHHIGAPLAGTIDDRSRPHGTAVLGIVCGASTTGGYVGLAPGLASVQVSSGAENLQEAIKAAIAQLVAINERDPHSAGGVLLLETQARLATSQGGMGHLPIETLPECFELIAGATRRGITVVEPAGNGRDTVGAPQGIDLDEFADSSGGLILRRDSARGDSGAIIVGAAHAAVIEGRHERLGSSNFGRRVDCYAWGERVRAPSSTSSAPFLTSGCTPDFGETSAAAAIIAGVTLIVQGVVTAVQPGLRLAPRELREILSRSSLGTRCKAASGAIGVMPDLAAILTRGVLGVTPMERSQSPAAVRG